MRRRNVYYRVGSGWHYTIAGEERGPFQTATEAGIAKRTEGFYRRSVRRAKAGEPLTFGDEMAEDTDWPGKPL